MNEITAAIKKKAEEKYVFIAAQEAYTCGGEDAMKDYLSFDEWKYRSGYRQTGVTTYQQRILGTYYTTEQLLLKYMEDNKL